MKEHMRLQIVYFKILIVVFSFAGCNQDTLYLHYAYKAAGENKAELKSVIKYYRTKDCDPVKLKAAKYLIANMPAHYSYYDTVGINSYYHTALKILGTGSGPDWQRDTLRIISDKEYSEITRNYISDVRVITARYLIYSIDHAFQQWRTRPWANYISYDDFLEWLLPYKVTELQSLDSWRDILSKYYSDSLRNVPFTDIKRNSTYGAIEIVRNEIQSKQSTIGHRVIWEDRSGIPMRSADTWTHMTYGSCMDYVTMGTAVFRSLGLPAAIDQVPTWGRNSEGHSWYVFLDDQGREQRTINSLIMPAGMQFYPYERIPKVWRNTYKINRDCVKYRKKAKYIYPFELCQQDVTEKYNLTSDLVIDIDRSIKLKDKKYVYVAMIVNSSGPQWKVLDYGLIRRGKAYFSKMGRNMLYIVLGYDGNKLIPISSPFILNKDGSIIYLNYKPETETTEMNLRRKYYESYNVVNMRRRLIGGLIQCSNNANFKDADTLYTIENTDIPYYIELKVSDAYRYWRYLCPNGSWGSISELSFYDEKKNRLTGRGIANLEAGQDAIERAFDGNYLSNFEINQPNDNWVGMDMLEPVIVHFASVSPRSDDNDICPGCEYELFFFDGSDWRSLGYKRADGNSLHYDNIPINSLLWLHNYTRGNNERPFIIKKNGDIEWW